MVLNEKEYHPLCPTPPAPIRKYKISLHKPKHLQHPKPYTRPAPPRGIRYSIRDQRDGNVPEQPWDAIFHRTMGGTTTESIDMPDDTAANSARGSLPCAFDAHQEVPWDPHRSPIHNAACEPEEVNRVVRYAEKLAQSTADPLMSTTFMKSAQQLKSSANHQQGDGVVSVPVPDDAVKVNMSFRTRKAKPVEIATKPPFVTCFGRIAEFKIPSDKQHDQLLKDIETDELLLKMRRLKKQELTQKAHGQVLREELREKMMTKMQQRLFDSLKRAEPHAVKKFQETLFRQDETMRKSEQCGVTEDNTLSEASPEGMALQLLESLRHSSSTFMPPVQIPQQQQQQTLMNKRGVGGCSTLSTSRPHTAKTIQQLRSTIASGDLDTFVEAMPSSARLVSARSREMVERKKMRIVHTPKYSPSWELSPQDVVKQLDATYYKARGLEEEDDD
eukprot:PhF_6_TR42099/c1_g1_i1/m.63548